MNIRIGLLCAALAASIAGCAHAPIPAAAPLTLDTHVDIPLDYMRDPRYDIGGDSALQVDLGKMERGGLDAAFFVIYVGQGPLTAEGYADAVAQADRKYSAIHLMLERYPDRIRLATTPAQVRGNHAAGLLSAMIGIENAYSLGHELSRLDDAYARGARYVGMTTSATTTCARARTRTRNSANRRSTAPGTPASATSAVRWSRAPMRWE